MSNKNLPGFPQLAPSQYVMVQAERNTGILLTIDGNRYIGEGELFVISESFDEIKMIANSRIATHADVECIIIDYEGNTIEIIRNSVDDTPNTQKDSIPWWKFWQR